MLVDSHCVVKYLRSTKSYGGRNLDESVLSKKLITKKEKYINNEQRCGAGHCFCGVTVLNDAVFSSVAQSK